MGIREWFKKRDELNKHFTPSHSLSDREHLINNILNRVYILEIWQDEPDNINVKNAILGTAREIVNLVERLQYMSYDELCMFRDSLEYMISAAKFKTTTECEERIMMNKIYREHGELIKEIFYGSEEESKEKVKTIR